MTARRSDDGLILSLSLGASAAEAARRAGCSERTVRRRLADPAFRAKVDEARAELLRETTGQITGMGKLFAAGLLNLLSDPKSEIRLGAIRVGLANVWKAAEIDVIDARLRALEAAEAARQKGKAR